MAALARLRILSFSMCGILILLLASFASAQQPATPPSVLVEEHAVRQVSPHVWVIDSKSRGAVPNIGIVVGSRATLVVDTGMGPRSGEIVMREVKRLTANPNLYLTFTHFHPEHSSGEQAFPANAIVIYSEAQQEDIQTRLADFLARFSARTAEMKDLLQGVKLRTPDILFDHEAKIDLGGVTARLLYFGPGHTHGDTLIFIEEDSVLLPGDIVQSRLFPNMPDSSASAVGWLAMLDKVEALHPRIIVSDHGEFPGGASLIAQERGYLSALEARVIELKKQGKSADEAAKILTPEFQAKYPDWTPITAIAAGTQRFYEELP